MSVRLSERTYKTNRGISPLYAALRKSLSLPARFFYGWRWRVRALRWMGVNIGRCYVGRDCLLDEEVPELITIEPGVVLSSRVTVMAHDSSQHIVAPVRVCARAFVGVGAILLPGVTIGEGAIVAAGAVVTRSVEPHTVVGGVPARLIRRLTREDHESEPAAADFRGAA